MKTLRLTTLILLFATPCFSQTQIVIEGSLSEQDLFSHIVNNYKTSTTMGYANSRDTLWSIIDSYGENQLACVYTGYTVTLDPAVDPTVSAYNNGKDINCEHTWPQSLGAGSEPQKSDMHHLFPTRVDANAARGNYPFGEIPDADTDKWFRLNTSQTSIPTQNIEEYSEVDNAGTFEPREDHKGNVARAMFYFYAIYNNVADATFWNKQKEVLLQWHYLDPVDQVEYDRTNHIAEYQNNIANPFVLDSTLARRIWFYEPAGVNEVPGAPSGVGATVSNDTIALKWNKNSEGDIAKYFIYGTESASTTRLDSTDSAADTSIVFFGLTLSNSYSFRITAMDTLGSESDYSQEVSGTILELENDLIPMEFSLSQNFPNPFNPSTNIHYALPEASNVNVIVYDIIGREVVSLVNEFQASGHKQVSWNGKDNAGYNVSAGMYLYHIQAGDYKKTMKMVLLK